MTDFRGGLTVAEEMNAVAQMSGDVTFQVIADWMLGSSHYVLGNPATSLRLFESGFVRGGARNAGRDQQLAGLYYRTSCAIRARPCSMVVRLSRPRVAIGSPGSDGGRRDFVARQRELLARVLLLRVPLVRRIWIPHRT